MDIKPTEEITRMNTKPTKGIIPMGYDKSQLATYESLNLVLMPLHPQSKKPKEKGWTKRDYKARQGEIDQWVSEDANLGVQIRSGHLVIDLDPRSYKDEVDSEQEVANLLGEACFEDIEGKYPLVKTGSGGWHIYLALPEGVDSKTLRKSSDDLPGVDFKMVGGQVVAAGSIHPDGGRYTWQGDYEGSSLPICRWPIIKILKCDREPGVDVDGDIAKGWGCLEPEELESEVLAKLNVEDFDTNDAWLELMMGAHHATGGEAKWEFIEWSIRDPEFSEDERIIEKRWDSLTGERVDARTAGTLVKILHSRGHDVRALRAKIFGNSALEDFNDDFVDSVGEAKKGALESVSALTKESGNEDLMRCLRLINKSDAITKEEAKEKLVEVMHGRFDRRALNRLLKDAQREVAEDIVDVVVDRTMETCFNGGKYIVVEPNGEVWTFHETHWIPTPVKFVERRIDSVIQRLKAGSAVQGSVATIIRNARDIILAKSALQKSKLFQVNVVPKAIIACKNGEVHIADDGTHTFIDKCNYKSYQTQCLATNYVKDSWAPLFMKTLKEIFQGDTEMIRHFGEIMGYMIQPNKNLEKWFLFRGPGGDGKTLLTELMSHLVGNAFCALNSADVDARRGSTNNHLWNDFVGAKLAVVGDLEQNVLLNDGFVKNMIGGASLTANPKNKDTFKFIGTSSLVICSNHYPKTRDNSHGFERRVGVVPFGASFTAKGTQDPRRKQRILESEQEVSGMLNFALEGLHRLRARGHFDEPEQCIAEKEFWLGEANNMAAFMKDCLDYSGNRDDKVGFLKEVYEKHYLAWCDNNGIESSLVLTVRSFGAKLRDKGYIVRKGTGGQRVVCGGKLKVGLHLVD